MDRRPVISAFVLFLAGILPAGPASQATAAQGATLAAASPVAAGDFSGLVDIGGRKLYLECRGQGNPTVILEAGAYARADVWSRDNQRQAGVRTRDKVADLHALLRAADIRGPYVLVAHSSGGLVVRLYASTYPDEVVGMVLLDSTHEDVWLRFQEALTPVQWAEFEALTVTNQTLLDAYPEAERWYTAPLADDATTGQVRQSRANAPLRPMPLVVLAHGIPFAAPSPGWPSDKMEGIMTALQEDLAKLVPSAHYAIATKSGHNIHQDQPELVIAAIREVVEAVRNPSTWTPAP